MATKSAKTESYIAHSSVKAGASAAAIASAYKIEIRFVGGLSTAQKNAFKGAAPVVQSNHRRCSKRNS